MTSSSNTPTQADRAAFAARILAEGRRLVSLRTPWRHFGRSDAGCDCIGFVSLCVERAGGPIALPPAYSANEATGLLQRALAAHCDLAPRGAAVDGVEIGEFATPGMALPAHVGFIHDAGGARHVLHAYLPAGRVIETVLAPPLSHLLRRRWRIRL